MLIYFVRHGQTDWNKALRWQGGNSDIELNTTGREQARAVRAWFVGQGITPAAILSSPMKRAVATAKRIASAFGQDIVGEPAFREVGLGDFEGKTTEELQAQYGEQFDQWLKTYHLMPAPGGESLEQAIERMRPALLTHIEQFGDQMIIVAHQAILMGMKAALSNDLRPETLATYKQANFEIDVWDVENASILKRIDIRHGE
jgi:broad specificity phosphatase PhoE